MAGEIHPFAQNSTAAASGDSKRRLAAVLAADVCGYSRLMEIDEEGTLARLKRIRRELIDPTIAEYNGRLIKNTGDGALVAFDSPVEAVRCAIVIQQSMIGRNATLPRAQWILFRVGVNLGDIIIDDDGDIYGDGVNIAARLESIAEPGGINISGGVYEQIKNKLVCGYQSLGDRKVKNITDPVPIYRVLPDLAAVKRARRSRGLIAAAAAIIVCSLAGGGWYYWSYLSNGPHRIAVATPPATPKPAASTAVSGTSAPPITSAKAPASEPELVALKGGSVALGSNDDPSEKPVHHVNVPPFAIGKYPVTVAQWGQCVAAKACAAIPAGDPEAPMTNLSWDDAQAYVRWLSKVTNRNYRLPTEAEWEYAARGGTDTKWWWGNQLKDGIANCKGCGEPYDPHRPAKVGAFQPNPFGLYDMGGAVEQWVADCWHKDYGGAPSDASAWTTGDCSAHVVRGGSWKSDPSYLRPAARGQYDTSVRYVTHGLRVARSE
jgi:formylglycine-generating enzyme required for sulfatase activity/class 3 adenylate cyclase